MQHRVGAGVALLAAAFWLAAADASASPLRDGAKARAAAKRARVDLAVTRVAPVAGPVALGGVLGLRATVANRGRRSVRGWRLRAQLLPPDGRPIVLSLRHRRLRALKPRRRTVVSLGAGVPRQLANGVYGARVCVVVPRRSRERVRRNNCRTVVRVIRVDSLPGTTTPPPAVDNLPGGLTGRPDQPALEVAGDVLEENAFVSDAEVTDGVIRTQLELAFRRDATVAQVNGLLRRLGARIVSHLSGVLIATVRIPDPGSLVALDGIVRGLDGQPGLESADEVRLSEPELLPDMMAAPGPDAAVIDHQLAVRAHAAWNARRALAASSPPTLLMDDYFGAGAPRHFDALGSDFAGDRPRPDGHGYHVLSVAAAAFDLASGGISADAEPVTGIFPGTPPLRAVDRQKRLMGSTVAEDEVIRLIRGANGRVVLNTSHGDACDTPEQVQRVCSLEEQRADGFKWARRVRGVDPNDRGANVEGKFVHASSAGNVDCACGPLPHGAMVNSDQNAAALAPLVDPATGEPVANLSNMLVVENFTNTPSEPFTPTCISPTSEIGGNIGAIGTRVSGFLSPTTFTPGTDADSGTSLAAPQAAGLAAYVWALRPDLTPSQVVALLQRTASPTSPGCGNGKVIDAYAAILAADEGRPDQPVRRTILDVANQLGSPEPDGAFNHHDVEKFIDEFGVRAGNRDYSRFDLNGDGTTGAGEDGRLDLNRDGSHGLAELDVEGLPLRFDENALTDHKILCHSAYSSLYASDDVAIERRGELLGLDACLNLDLKADFPTTVTQLQNNRLTVTARDLDLPDGNGDFRGQKNVFLELSAIGGEVAQNTGTTDENGHFDTDAFLAAGETQLDILIIARASQGGPELARTVVSATADGVPSVTVEDTFTGCNFDDCKVQHEETENGLTFAASLTGTPSIATAVNGSTITIDGRMEMTGVATVTGENPDRFFTDFAFPLPGCGSCEFGGGASASFSVDGADANVCLNFTITFDNTGGGLGVWRQLGSARAVLHNAPAGQDAEASVDLIASTTLVSDSDEVPQKCFLVPPGDYQASFTAGLSFAFATRERGPFNDRVDSRAVSSGTVNSL